MLIFILLLLSFNVVVKSETAAAITDEITGLPGLKYTINFRQYSGYLNATDGKFLHYWFVESQLSPPHDPVVLWLNGGPGCSSMDGLLSELGPFRVRSDGITLYDNPFAWNKIANVLFLEAPAGVGYSFSTSQKYSTDDDQVSYDNYLALQHFFEKFPSFKKNDFYITGESYGGIYIPTLSVRVLTGSADMNFKGFAIGNGYLDSPKLGNSIVFFAYYHGLIGKKTWTELTKYCCNGCDSEDKCEFVNNITSECQDGVSRVHYIIQSAGLNFYNLYSDCLSSALTNSSRFSVDRRLMLSSLMCPSSLCKIQDSPPCIDASNITFWINQKSVRKALHIPSFLPEWSICSSAVESGYKRLYDTMSPQILKLVKSGKLRGLIYNGDVDMACNFLGDEWFVDSLGLKLVKDFQLWNFNGQIAGFLKQYQNLTYVTVKGSGHMVPSDKPGPAFKMISSFLYNKPY